MSKNKNLAKELKTNLDALTKFAMQLVKNKELAEELVQQACLIILTKCENYVNKNHFLSYAKVVVLNIFRNEYKRTLTHRGHQAFLITEMMETIDPQTKLEKKEFNQKINKIDPKYLEPFKMFVLEKAKYKEIAERLDISEHRVRYLIRKARQQLKILLKDEYIIFIMIYLNS